MREAPISSYKAPAKPFPLPAPTGGWNARDPLAKMSPKDAVFLDNLFPEAGSVDLRKGSELFSTLPDDVYDSSPHNVRSLLSYNKGDGTKKLFAGVDDGLYDITAGGTIASVSSAATNNDWVSVNIATPAGTYLWCCNGVDVARHYDGSSWANPTIGGIGAEEDISHVNLHARRLFFCEKDTLSLWYLDVNSIAGTAAEFPLGAIFAKGGYLRATASWSVDSGEGMDDYFVAITSEGEVAIYAGVDPSTAADWVLKGVYQLPRPMSKHCFVKIGGDLGVLTEQGLYPMSAVISGDFEKAAISDKIDSAWKFYTKLSKDKFGWDVVYFSGAPFVLVNIPILSQHQYSSGVVSWQFVMNTQTKAWCRFYGWNAECFTVHDGELYYGHNNKVYKAWTGEDDAGVPIDGKGKTAFIQPFKNTNTQITLARPQLTGSANLGVQFGLDVDYREDPLSNPSALLYGDVVAEWDTAVWDLAQWTSRGDVQQSWRTVTHHPGKVISVRLRVRRSGVIMSWIATQLIGQQAVGLL